MLYVLCYVMLCYVTIFFGTLDFSRLGVWDVGEFGTLGPWDFGALFEDVSEYEIMQWEEHKIGKVFYMKKNGKMQAFQKAQKFKNLEKL